MTFTTCCGRASVHLVSAWRWLISFALGVALAACGGAGGAGSDEMPAESAGKAVCSYQHLYLTVELVRVRQLAVGGEQWMDITLPAPQRIDLMNPGGGLLQALGAALLPAGNYSEVRLMPASNDEGTGLANAVQPTGSSPAPLIVPNAAQS